MTVATLDRANSRTRRCTSGLVLAAAFALQYCASCRARASEETQEELPGGALEHVIAEGTAARPDPISGAHVSWRSQRACGLNCLYFVLRYGGTPASYDDLERQLLGNDRTSLLDLKLAAEQYGIRIRPAKVTPEDLQRSPMPVIAHLDVVGVRGDSGGHFIVITAVTQDGLRYVDGTTLETRDASWPDFQRDWSGFIAHPESTSPIRVRHTQYALSILSFLSGAILAMVFQRNSRWKVCRVGARGVEVRA